MGAAWRPPLQDAHHCGDPGPRSQLAEARQRFERAGAQVLDLPALVIAPRTEMGPA